MDTLGWEGLETGYHDNHGYHGYHGYHDNHGCPWGGEGLETLVVPGVGEHFKVLQGPYIQANILAGLSHSV